MHHNSGCIVDQLKTDRDHRRKIVDIEHLGVVEVQLQFKVVNSRTKMGFVEYPGCFDLLNDGVCAAT